MERVIGSGGMGVVIAAFHLQLAQLVALKLLRPEVAENPEVVQRFSREARAAAKIESEHVARVLDVGELEAGPYIVMEHLEGDNLEQLLGRRGRLTVADAMRYALEACDAVAEAHEVGLVHRDLKPSNVFVAKKPDGGDTVKLLDFGLVKFMPSASTPLPSITRTSALIGSPAYMAPEQLRCPREVDARADIWSLGAIVYEMLCGTSPFARATMPEICAAILTEPPAPPRALRSEIQPGLEAIVLRCLEKEPSARYADVAELAKELLLFAPPGAERTVERIVRVQRTAAVNQADPFAATKLEPTPAPRSAQPPAHAQEAAPPWFPTVVLFGGSLLFATGASLFAWTMTTEESRVEHLAASTSSQAPRPAAVHLAPRRPARLRRPTSKEPSGSSSGQAPSAASAPRQPTPSAESPVTTPPASRAAPGPPPSATFGQPSATASSADPATATGPVPSASASAIDAGPR